MFDFLDADWFNISLQILFLVLIIFDIKKYLQTKKKQYIVNIVLTIGFAIWVLVPYYRSYFDWTKNQKSELISHCGDSNNSKLCRCLDEATFKNYSYDEYIVLDKNSSNYSEFIKDAKEDCLDDSWF